MAVLTGDRINGAFLQKNVWAQRGDPGAHHWEPPTALYSCHGVFKDRSILSLNLSRIRIPTGTSVTNCDHKHGLMLTCQHDIGMLT